jgi:ribosomal protein S18 acetylase RimI-like enzyme
VDAAARGRGIGRALLAEVESRVRAHGGCLLLVETSSSPPYAAARRFYEVSGYRNEAIIHNFYARGDDLLVFCKDLGETEPLCQVTSEWMHVVSG